MSTDHPRRWRVTRRTPGTDWDTRTHTYHRTRGQAREAAARFFGGCHPYGEILRGQRAQTSEIILCERVGRPWTRTARYEEVTRWTDRHIL